MINHIYFHLMFVISIHLLIYANFFHSSVLSRLPETVPHPYKQYFDVLNVFKRVCQEEVFIPLYTMVRFSSPDVGSHNPHSLGFFFVDAF